LFCPEQKKVARNCSRLIMCLEAIIRLPQEIYKPIVNILTMWMYSRHYKLLRGEHYRWRDFVLLLATKKDIYGAETQMDRIMQKIFGIGINSFQTSDIKQTESDKVEGSWKVTNIFTGNKYPKSRDFGEYIHGKIEPIDWIVNKY
jgi:hypothetical protein